MEFTIPEAKAIRRLAASIAVAQDTRSGQQTQSDASLGTSVRQYLINFPWSGPGTFNEDQKPSKFEESTVAQYFYAFPWKGTSRSRVMIRGEKSRRQENPSTSEKKQLSEDSKRNIDSFFEDTFD